MCCNSIDSCAPPDRAAEVSPCIVRPRGVLTADRAEGLGQLLDTARDRAAQNGGSAVLDLSRVELLGGEAIGVVLLRREGLSVREPAPRVRRQLSLLKLDRLLLGQPA